MRVTLRLTCCLAAIALSSACADKPATPSEKIAAADSSASAVVTVATQELMAIPASAKDYGKAITLKETTQISAILKDPKLYEGKRVLVRGPNGAAGSASPATRNSRHCGSRSRMA